MENIKIPYGRKEVEIQVPKKNLLGIFHSRINRIKVEKTAVQIINDAMANPIKSKRLRTLAVGKKSAVIITSDHTRPVPSRITMPVLLSELRENNSEIEITILIATGVHRETTKDELLEKFGPEICENENIVIHKAADKDDLTFFGILPSGGELYLNKLLEETDLLVAEGFIEPHFFAGFSGGRKSVLPGVAGEKSILANHCSEFIQDKNARTGVLLDNPIQKDMLWAAARVNLKFILNVVLNEKKIIVNAFAGHREYAHEEGCTFLMDKASVTKNEADIVICGNGGYPLDQNIYQSVKGLTAAEATCKKDGIIIMLSKCSDGHGGESFFENIANAESPAEVTKKVIKIDRDNTIADQWEFQILARIMEKHEIYFVSEEVNEKIITAMHLRYARTFEQAFREALVQKGEDAKIVVIPDAVSVIVKNLQEN